MRVFVLLAENSASNRLVARSVLEREGYYVRFANDGDNAIQLARISNFDVILLDIVMPRMGGLVAAENLRKMMQVGTVKPTQIIALTAYDTPDDIRACYDAGFDGLIAKPLRPGDVRAALQRAGQTQHPALVGAAANYQDPCTLPLVDEAIIRDGPGLADELTRERIWRSYRTGLSKSLKDIARALPGSLDQNEQCQKDFRLALHALRSASLTVGMSRAPQLARELRDAPADKIAETTAALLLAIRDSLPVLEGILKEIRSDSITAR
jgi:CheY-like chemotaxis protein